ncbi:MAG: helix-turn-helix transcriptional regulator [Pseudomonadota bacterium]
MPENWSAVIRQYRARFGLTQQAFAALLGVSQRTVSRWERGQDRPNIERQRQLRDLGWTPTSLMLRNLAVSVRHCPVPRALSHTRDLRLLEVSKAAVAKRPSIRNWVGHRLRPIATGVLADIMDDGALQKALARRELSGLVTTTGSVLETGDAPVTSKFHTTISYFYEDGDLFSDAISVPAAADATCGYTPIYHDEEGGAG